jgi:hypothetical protein
MASVLTDNSLPLLSGLPALFPTELRGMPTGSPGSRSVTAITGGDAVMTLRQIIDRILGRDGRGEADVAPDPDRADAREAPRVGRVAADDDLT